MIANQETVLPVEMDAVVLRQFLHDHLDSLRDYISRHLPHNVRPLIEPEDVIQDTVLSAFQRIGEFKPTESDAACRWLLTIARNRMISLARAAAAAKRGGGCVVSEDELQNGSVVAMLSELAIYERTPSQSASRREIAVILERSLGALSDDYRRAVRLRYIKGHSLAEIAQLMERSEDAAQQLCLRGLRALRIALRSVSLSS
jgi:RNA polymerase sigma factor (sigma-70 family)